MDISNTEEMFTLEDIRKSDVLSYGLFTLFKTIGEKNGLIEDLGSTFLQSWKEVFMLASYTISSGNPLMYYDIFVVLLVVLQLGKLFFGILF